jgi:VanZ family protein
MITAVVAGVIVLGSLLPPPSVLLASPVPGPASLALPASGAFEPGVDKLLHASGYAVLAGFAAAWRGKRGVVLVGVVLAVAALGLGVEVLQTAVPGRTGTVGDAVANLAGAVVGVAGWRRWSRQARSVVHPAN